MKSFFLCLIGILIMSALTGCQSAMIGGQPRIIEGTATAPDGVEIAYDVRGRGKTTLFFIHGWCSNRAFWREQLDALAAEYRVVAIDLPGHGASGRDRATWSCTAFGRDVQAVAESLNLKRIILIGHSLGGPVSLDAAQRMPGRVIGVIAVDTLRNVEIQATAEMLERIASAFETDFNGTMRAFLPQFFLPDADPELVQWVIERSLAADHEMAAAIMRDQGNVNQKTLLSSASVPVRGINAAAGQPGPPATAIETNRQYADFDAVFIDGVGHFLQLENPEQFNRQLRKVLAGLEQRRRPPPFHASPWPLYSAHQNEPIIQWDGRPARSSVFDVAEASTLPTNVAHHPPLD